MKLDQLSKLLTGQMKRIPIVQDRQPQGCGCRAYMDVFTACLEQWVSFYSITVVCNRIRACNVRSLQQNQTTCALMSNSSCSS